MFLNASNPLHDAIEELQRLHRTDIARGLQHYPPSDHANRELCVAHAIGNSTRASGMLATCIIQPIDMIKIYDLFGSVDGGEGGLEMEEEQGCCSVVWVVSVSAFSSCFVTEQ